MSDKIVSIRPEMIRNPYTLSWKAAAKLVVGTAVVCTLGTIAAFMHARNRDWSSRLMSEGLSLSDKTRLEAIINNRSYLPGEIPAAVESIKDMTARNAQACLANFKAGKTIGLSDQLIAESDEHDSKPLKIVRTIARADRVVCYEDKPTEGKDKFVFALINLNTYRGEPYSNGKVDSIYDLTTEVSIQTTRASGKINTSIAVARDQIELVDGKFSEWREMRWFSSGNYSSQLHPVRPTNDSDFTKQSSVAFMKKTKDGWTIAGLMTLHSDEQDLLPAYRPLVEVAKVVEAKVYAK